MTVTAMVKALLTFLQQDSLMHVEMKLALTSSAKFFWHVLRLPTEFFAQRYAGEIASRLQLNDRVATLLSGDVATNLVNIFLIGIYAALLIQYDAVLTLIGVLIAAVNIAALRIVQRRRVDQNRHLLQEQGSLMGVSVSGLQTIETLKSSASESDFFARWAGYQAKVVNAEQRFGYVLGVPFGHSLLSDRPQYCRRARLGRLARDERLPDHGNAHCLPEPDGQLHRPRQQIGESGQQDAGD